jgi:hypothetical protein
MKNCPICFEDKNDKEFLKTKCDHEYCIDCIKTWIDIHNTCPTCRRIIKTDESNSISKIFKKYLILIVLIICIFWFIMKTKKYLNNTTISLDDIIFYNDYVLNQKIGQLLDNINRYYCIDQCRQTYCLLPYTTSKEYCLVSHNLPPFHCCISNCMGKSFDECK